MIPIVSLAILASIPAVFAQNIIANPGFELNGLSAGSGDSFDITSWVQSGNAQWFAFDAADGATFQPPAIVDAEVYSLAVGSIDPANPDIISQATASVPATCYAVAFDATSGGTDDTTGYSLVATWGTHILDVSGDIADLVAEYQHFSFLLPSAPAGGTTLSFTGYNEFAFSAIDQISVTQVANSVYNAASDTCTCAPGFVFNVAGSNSCTLAASIVPRQRSRGKRSHRFGGVPW